MENRNGGQQQVETDIDETQMDTDLAPEVVEGIKDEDTRKHLGTTIAQKNHWREKAKKAQAEFDEYKKAHPETKTEPVKQTPAKKEKADGFDPEAFKNDLREEIRVEAKFPDITEAEMTRAKALAQVEGKSLLETVSDDLFQAYMARNREGQATDKARPAPSNRGGNPSGYTVADLADPEKVKAMPMEIYSKLVASDKNRLRGTLSKS